MPPILSTIRNCRRRGFLEASVAKMVRKLIISWYLRRCKVLVQHPASASLDPITSASGEHSRSISKFLNVSACKISRDGSHLTKLKQLCTTLEWQMMYLIWQESACCLKKVPSILKLSRNLHSVTRHRLTIQHALDNSNLAQRPKLLKTAEDNLRAATTLQRS